MITCAAVFPLNSGNFVHRFPHNYERCEERSTPESGHHLLVGNLAHNLKNLMNNEPFFFCYLPTGLAGCLDSDILRPSLITRHETQPRPFSAQRQSQVKQKISFQGSAPTGRNCLVEMP